MMMPDRVTFMSLIELADLLRRKEVSPLELVDAFLARMENSDDVAASAYITVARERARRNAETAETRIRTGKYRGVLQGIPYACKDLFLTEGIRTTAGSRVLADWVPDTNADVVSRLSAAGGALLGKLNQHEFAYGATGQNRFFGTVPNPWDTDRLAGGSSSGSAAAVAAGLAVFTLGTDTGGSTRAPAALCGVVGLKPTFGLVSTSGVIPYCWTLDHVGIFSRTVKDAAAVLETLTRHDARSPRTTGPSPGLFGEAPADDLRGVRIGIPRTFFFERMDEEIYSAVQRAIGACGQFKAELIDIEMPPMDKTRTASLLIQLPEMLSYHSRYLPEKKHLYGEDLRSGMALGQFILAEHYIQAKRMMQWYRNKMDGAFQAVDILITPTCPITAPRIGSDFVSWKDEKEPVGNAITRFTSFFNLTGHPAISIPCGFHSSGLPMGMQLVGRHFEEKTLLRVAHFLEQCLNGPTKVPPCRKMGDAPAGPRAANRAIAVSRPG